MNKYYDKNHPKYPDFLLKALRSVCKVEVTDEELQAMCPGGALEYIWNRIKRDEISDDISDWFYENYGIYIKSKKRIMVILRGNIVDNVGLRNEYTKTVWAPYTVKQSGLIAVDDPDFAYNVYYLDLDKRYAWWWDYSPFAPDRGGYASAKIASIKVVHEGESGKEFEYVLNARKEVDEAIKGVKYAQSKLINKKKKYLDAIESINSKKKVQK